MRKLLSGCLITFIILSSAELRAQATDNYFPLHVGDYWRYKGDEQIWDAIKVVDTTLVSGEKYYIREHPLPYIYYDTLGFGSSGLIKQLVRNENRTLYEFNVAVGDSWSYYSISPNDTIRMVVQLAAKLDSFKIIDGPLRGAYHNVVVFFSDAPGYYDASSYDYLAPGFGLIYREWQLDRRTLYGAVIDGILYGDTTTTNIKENQASVLTDFQLLQNYPNPFNPATSIGYQIPEGGYITLQIFDVIGREVATLVHQNQKPGKYNVEFNAANVSSGMYFYQLRVNDFVSTKKMMLLK